MNKLTDFVNGRQCNPKKENITYVIDTQETMASGRFMRGTDPIKSTWEYPNLLLYFRNTQNI